MADLIRSLWTSPEAYACDRISQNRQRYVQEIVLEILDACNLL
jgi:hypothetical protein